MSLEKIEQNPTIFGLRQVGLTLKKVGIKPNQAGKELKPDIRHKCKKGTLYFITTVTGTLKTENPGNYIAISCPNGQLIMHHKKRTNTLFVAQPGGGFLPFKEKHNRVFVAAKGGGFYDFDPSDNILFIKSAGWGYEIY